MSSTARRLAGMQQGQHRLPLSVRQDSPVPGVWLYSRAVCHWWLFCNAIGYTLPDEMPRVGGRAVHALFGSQREVIGR